MAIKAYHVAQDLKRALDTAAGLIDTLEMGLEDAKDVAAIRRVKQKLKLAEDEVQKFKMRFMSDGRTR